MAPKWASEQKQITNTTKNSCTHSGTRQKKTEWAVNLVFSVGNITFLWRVECRSCNPLQNSPKTKNFSKLSNELCWQFSMIPLKLMVVSRRTSNTTNKSRHRHRNKKDWFIRHVLKFIASIDPVTRDHTRHNVNPLPPGSPAPDHFAFGPHQSR